MGEVALKGRSANYGRWLERGPEVPLLVVPTAAVLGAAADFMIEHSAR